MMKKNSLILMVIVVLCLCACGKISSAPEAVTTNMPDVAQEETLRDKLLGEIEFEYNEESNKPEYTTTVGMVDLANKYAEKWEDVSVEYYDKILAYLNNVSGDEKDVLIEQLAQLKEKHEEYLSADLDMYTGIYSLKYKNGSIVGPLCASKHYELQKEYALNIIEIYESLTFDT